MDERRLVELFRDAAGDAPPASFDEHDVAARSRRVTQRRRSMLAGGGGLAVVVLAVSLLLGPLGFGHTLRSGTQSAASAPDVRGGPARTDPGRFGPALEGPAVRGTDSFPSSSPVQGGGKVGGVGPNAGSTQVGCGPTDREVAVALAGELPSVGAPAVAPGLTCHGTTRVATYLVHDGSATGYVTAVLTPRGNPATLQPAAGALSSSGSSATGKWLVTVIGEPAGGQGAPPLADRLGAVERAVAARF